MNVYIIKSEQPKCAICGEVLHTWNPFATKHTHIECDAKVLTNILVKALLKQLK